MNSPTLISLDALFHQGVPKWYINMVGEVLTSHIAIEELFDKKLECSHIKAENSFSKKLVQVLETLNEDKTESPWIECSLLNKIRNLCSHKRLHRNEEQQNKLISCLKELEEAILKRNEKLEQLADAPYFKWLVTVLTQEIASKLKVNYDPVILGGLHLNKKECGLEYFFE